jgi:hypothetical protein
MILQHFVNDDFTLGILSINQSNLMDFVGREFIILKFMVKFEQKLSRFI